MFSKKFRDGLSYGHLRIQNMSFLLQEIRTEVEELVTVEMAIWFQILGVYLSFREYFLGDYEPELCFSGDL